MDTNSQRVCPVERAGTLDNRFRRWIQNPEKILKPYVHTGMRVLDFGCGPGFFTIDMAHMVGETGRVIAVDLQEGMLEKVRQKLRNTPLKNRVTLHRCKEDSIGLSDPVDFVLAFYIVHELPDPERFFMEIASVLTPGGGLLVVEPPFHVSKSEFDMTLAKGKAAGLIPGDGPRVMFSKSAVLTKPL